MSETMLQRFEKLVEEGSNLTPLGGFDFSGYNARLQDKYLAWRKACLASIESVGPIGTPYKSKISADVNGGLFYQSSANLIFTSIRELFEKLKASPDLASEPIAAPVAAAPVRAPDASQPSTGGSRTLKPPPKAAAPAVPPGAAPRAQAVAKKAFVIGEINDPLRQQLAQFLENVGVNEIPVYRVRGEMLALDSITDSPDVKFAFFILTSEHMNYSMFELGHFVGKLGKNRVMVLHMMDVDVPKNIPGVLVKPIVVKLEEASLSIIKELSSAGYALEF